MGGHERDEALPSRQSSLTSCCMEPTLAPGLGVKRKAGNRQAEHWGAGTPSGAHSTSKGMEMGDVLGDVLGGGPLLPHLWAAISAKVWVLEQKTE